MAVESSIMVGVNESSRSVHVKAEGRCVMKICRDLQDYLATFHTPEKTDIYFDLSRVEAVDSTFTGMLLALATKRQHPQTPNIHICSPSQRVRAALETMHVWRFFDVCEAPPSEPDNWIPLSTEPIVPGEAADLIIHAHQELIDADDRNEEEFGPVAEAFRKEQNRPSDKGQD